MNITIGATEAHYFTGAQLKAGDTVAVRLVSDLASDVFKIQIVNGAGSGLSYLSTDGMLNVTHTISRDGQYYVYITGCNSDGRNIHIDGTISLP